MAKPKLLKFTQIYSGLQKITGKIAVLLILGPGTCSATSLGSGKYILQKHHAPSFVVFTNGSKNYHTLLI